MYGEYGEWELTVIGLEIKKLGWRRDNIYKFGIKCEWGFGDGRKVLLKKLMGGMVGCYYWKRVFFCVKCIIGLIVVSIYNRKLR